MGSLGLQRSWGCHGKFGRPNCMRLVGREAVDRTAVFVCRPKDTANHTWGASEGRIGVVVARVGNQHRYSVRMVSDWGWRCWLGCGRKSPAMMGLWYVSWLVVWV